jgi:hypothetical protein
VYSAGKSRALILAEIAERRVILYTRPQRLSIYHPARAGDLAFEITKKVLKYLNLGGREDLVSASCVCRAWYASAKDLITSYAMVINAPAGTYACGLALRSMYGVDLYTQIKDMYICVYIDDLPIVDMMPEFLGRALSCLRLDFQDLEV